MHDQQQTSSLPSRVYERHGVRTYSIGYKRPNGTWAFRLSCHISDQEEIAALREEAIHRATGDQQDCLHSKTFSTVAKHWLNWQKTLPRDSAEKRADSTLAENEREVAQLIRAFGRRKVTALTKVDAYTYQRDSQSKGRSAKGNKEIALARLILEYAVTLGILINNPFDRVAYRVLVKVNTTGHCLWIRLMSLITVACLSNYNIYTLNKVVAWPFSRSGTLSTYIG